MAKTKRYVIIPVGLMTTGAAAKLMGVSTRRILQYIHDRRLPAEKLGRDFLVSRGDVVALHEEMQTHAYFAKHRADVAGW